MNYDWACQGTSLNPNPSSATYMTTYVTGNVETDCPSCDGDASTSMVFSLTMTLLLAFAMFFN